MRKIYEVSKIKEIDRYTISQEPIEPAELVERAATVFSNEFCRRFPKNSRVFVFAGFGNNGADALAIARLLAENDYTVNAYLFNPKGILSTECQEHTYRIQAVRNVHFSEITTDFNPPELTEKDIIIDGLFGSGLNRPLDGGFAAIVDFINDSDAEVVSIDIPSGLFGEDNTQNNYDHVVQADLTLTFEYPKLSFLMRENEDYVGEWKVLPIGLICPKDVKCVYGLVSDDLVSKYIYPRDRFNHKGDFGHALLLAGGLGKMGAAVLSAKGCMRSGVGLLTVHIPQRGETIMQTSLPEAMVELDSENDLISSIPEDLSKYDAIAMGPGIGLNEQTIQAVKSLISQIGKRPLILDADAINIVAKAELLHQLPEGTILTPHPKEFDRLAGESNNSYERLQKARSIANEHKICIVLKGAYTAICFPNGRVFFNTSGNPGMATAGSGDVLTGIILGLSAQGYSPEIAAFIGTYIHGAAGDLASSALSGNSMIAGDIVAQLGSVFLQLQKEQ